jgi:hypothetical protein
MRTQYLGAVAAGSLLIQPTSAGSVNATGLTASQLSAPNHSRSAPLEVFERGRGSGGSGKTASIAPTTVALATSISTAKASKTTKTTKTAQPTNTAKDYVATAVDAWYDASQALGLCNAQNDWETEAKSLMEHRNDTSPDSTWGKDVGTSMKELTNKKQCPTWPGAYKKKEKDAMLTVGNEMEANNTDTIS